MGVDETKCLKRVRRSHLKTGVISFEVVETFRELDRHCLSAVVVQEDVYHIGNHGSLFQNTHAGLASIYKANVHGDRDTVPGSFTTLLSLILRLFSLSIVWLGLFYLAWPLRSSLACLVWPGLFGLAWLVRSGLASSVWPGRFSLV